MYFDFDEKINIQKLENSKIEFHKLNFEETMSYMNELATHIKQKLIYSGIGVHISRIVLEKLLSNLNESIAEEGTHNSNIN